MATSTNTILTLQVAPTGAYPVDDLRDLVEWFRKSTARIPLAMSGAEARAFMGGQRDGAPSLGWIKTLWLDGIKLMATVEDVPKSLLPKLDSAKIQPEIRGGQLLRVVVSGLHLPRPRSLEAFSVAMHSDGVTVRTYSLEAGDDHGLMSVDRLVQTRIAETGQTYANAARDVFEAFPEVAREYFRVE